MDPHIIISVSIALVIGIVVGWFAKAKYGADVAADEAHIASELKAYRARVVADAEKAEAEEKKVL
jgi:hypothetical protein